VQAKQKELKLKHKHLTFDFGNEKEKGETIDFGPSEGFDFNFTTEPEKITFDFGPSEEEDRIAGGSGLPP